MARTIRFHLDELCSKALADGLRRRGIDVTTTPEAGLLGALDPEQIAFALRVGRVIFTQDEDFLVLHASGVQHAGIAFCQQDALSIGQVIQGLELIWDIYESAEMLNHIEWL